MTPITQAQDTAIIQAKLLLEALEKGEEHKQLLGLLNIACGELNKYQFEAKQEATGRVC